MYSVQALRHEWVTNKGIAPEDFLVLVLHTLQITHTQFAKEKDHHLTDSQHQALSLLLSRRAQHEPVAYLIGHKEFFGRDFTVTPATLIPRPDSECLIEDILHTVQNTRKPKAIFDIGTGSGALAITLHKELQDDQLQVIASDISAAALEIAKENAKTHQANITFLHGSLLEPYLSLPHQSLSPLFIIANLPYVSQELLEKAEPDVKDYEPVTALLSEEAGLAHYHKLLQELKNSSFHGFCWLEISPEQSQILSETIKETFPDAEVYRGKDLAQRSRFLRFSF